MRRLIPWLCLAIAILGGIFAGWVDFNNDEPQAAVLVILVLTFLCGMLFPKKAWLWAVIIALGVPGVYLLATNLGYQPVSPPSPGWYASLLALIPAFIGAYSGVVGRMVLNSVSNR